jgi:hypothetical protein
MTTPSDEAVEAAIRSFWKLSPPTGVRNGFAWVDWFPALRAAYAIDMDRVRREALEDAAQALEAAHEDCATLNLLHGAARIRALANTKQE